QREETLSRIDYIWANEELSHFTQNAGITNIDYSLFRKKEGKRPTRKLFLYHKATDKNWALYEKCLDHHISNALVSDKKKDPQKKIPVLDEEWGIIVNSIIQAASKYIPSIKVGKTLKNATGQEINTKIREELNEKIVKANQDFNCEIPLLPKIEMQLGMMEKDKKKMLQSLLNYLFNKVALDRILLKESLYYQNQELVNNKVEVKRYMVLHFQRQFRKRAQKFDKLDEFWKLVYKPREWIDSKWYESILELINLEE
ncbi:43851_t:CDS:2, partial [Gigaspora margarita]